MKKQKGITLVALVISIIILLILAGISISALTNQGLFGRANEAKRESEIANIKEQIALDIYEKQLEPPVGNITEEQLETILGKYGTVNKEDERIVGITTAKGYEILLKDIYGGETVAESVPDGATVTPVNDITTWLKTGGISEQYSYTTIEQVIADSNCTKSLMNNENAMKYLARSTEFADAICASETTMTYLGKSAYVDDTVLNSDLWKQSIKASQYWTLVYASKTVTVYGGAYETITIEGYYGSFTTNANGSVSHVVPIDTITLTGSISGQSFTRTVTNDTTEVYAMPEDALYWYGNKTSIGGSSWDTSTKANSSHYTYSGTAQINTNNIGMIVPTGTSNYNGIFTSDKIDFSKYEKMCGITSLNGENTVYGEVDISSINEVLYLWLSSTHYYTSMGTNIIPIKAKSNGFDDLEYNVNAICTVRPSPGEYGYIHAIWFE